MLRTVEWILIVLGLFAAMFAQSVADQTGVSLDAVRTLVGLSLLVLIVRAWWFPPVDPLLQQFAMVADRPPFSPADYQQHDLGPLKSDTQSRELYIDLLQRALVNVIYEDVSLMIYDGDKQSRMPDGFELSKRLVGQDVPWQAHTMAGIHRLRNLRDCVQTLLQEKVPGDLIECGVLRGGASIFLRGLLKAHGETQRKVYACDTYCPRPPIAAWHRQLIFPVLSLLARIPSTAWRRWLCTQMLRGSGSFPLPENPSAELIDSTVFTIQNISLMSRHRGTSVAEVQSHFARYGLWDDQVVMLQGFFSDTLPHAPIQQVALLRLDGDTFESTRDVLDTMYDKLAPGGFCIVDDYGAYVDCQRAIEEFRTARGITDPIIPIDSFGAYWRKGK